MLAERPSHPSSQRLDRVYLTPDEAAALLRTTRRAVYILIERGQLGGSVRRLGRRILLHKGELVAAIERQAAK